jgi:hypothetical protein
VVADSGDRSETTFESPPSSDSEGGWEAARLTVASAAIPAAAAEPEDQHEDQFQHSTAAAKKKKKRKKKIRPVARAGPVVAAAPTDLVDLSEPEPEPDAATERERPAGPAPGMLSRANPRPAAYTNRRRRRPRRHEGDHASSDGSEAEGYDPNAHKKYSIFGQEKQDRYKKVFEDIDVNNDGSLSIQELERSLESANPSMRTSDPDSTAAATGEEKKFVQTLLDVQNSAARDGLDFKTFCIVLALSEASEGLDVFLGGRCHSLTDLHHHVVSV